MKQFLVPCFITVLAGTTFEATDRAAAAQRRANDDAARNACLVLDEALPNVEVPDECEPHTILDLPQMRSEVREQLRKYYGNIMEDARIEAAIGPGAKTDQLRVSIDDMQEIADNDELSDEDKMTQLRGILFGKVLAHALGASAEDKLGPGLGETKEEFEGRVVEAMERCGIEDADEWDDLPIGVRRVLLGDGQ